MGTGFYSPVDGGRAQLAGVGDRPKIFYIEVPRVSGCRQDKENEVSVS
jgi:hypothetical protein